MLGRKLVAYKFHCDKMGKNNTFPLCPNNDVDISQEVSIFALNMTVLNISTNISRGIFFMY